MFILCVYIWMLAKYPFDKVARLKCSAKHNLIIFQRYNLQKMARNVKVSFYLGPRAGSNR